jgi:hypothetical protein
MSKQLSVSEVPKTRCVIGHCIGRAGNMVIAKAVAMVTLVKAAQTKEVGGRVAGRDGAFGGAADGRGIVVEEGESAFTGVDGLG